MEHHELAPYRSALSALLRQSPRPLKPEDMRKVMPPRGPRGAPENQLRGVVLRSLQCAGFTIDLESFEGHA